MSSFHVLVVSFFRGYSLAGTASCLRCFQSFLALGKQELLQPKEGKEEEGEAAASVAVAKEISRDTAVATVLPEPDNVFAFKERQ